MGVRSRKSPSESRETTPHESVPLVANHGRRERKNEKRTQDGKPHRRERSARAHVHVYQRRGRFCARRVVVVKAERVSTPNMTAHSRGIRIQRRAAAHNQESQRSSLDRDTAAGVAAPIPKSSLGISILGGSSFLPPGFLTGDAERDSGGGP